MRRGIARFSCKSVSLKLRGSHTENLGSQIMEGVQVTGLRTTRTIAVGKIGNDRPITIVTEVWTSPELKTIVLSKRSDPRMGEQTFKLTNIQRSEPDPSLFTVPSDFKVTEGGPRPSCIARSHSERPHAKFEHAVTHSREGVSCQSLSRRQEKFKGTDVINR